jgi:hypothetical protein
MIFFTPTTILIATVFGFIFGALWYSPILFMNAWLMGEGITKKDAPKRTKVYLLQINLYSFIAHGAIASILAIMFDLLQVASLKVATSLGALLALSFIVTTHYIDMLYTMDGVHFSRKAQVKFLVNSGYYICVVSIMAATIFFFASM